MNSAFAEVNGQRLHYVCEGEGELMLFVHGFPEFWYEWRKQLAEFGKTHCAVALDMRGYNLSSKPPLVTDYRAKHLVEDLRAFIEHLGYRQCVMVAHDWGGAIAWNFAAQHPAYLKKLIIINAPHPAIFQRELLNNPAQSEASRYMLLFRDPKAERVMSENNYARTLKMLTGLGGEAVWLSDEDTAKYREAWSQPGALTGGLNYYRASPLHPPTDTASGPANVVFDKNAVTVRVPTLVIWGEKDSALLRGNLDGLEEYVPDLTISRIPDGSHWVVHEQPERVNQLIRQFIA